jgi:hypothetical protein
MHATGPNTPHAARTCNGTRYTIHHAVFPTRVNLDAKLHPIFTKKNYILRK